MEFIYLFLNREIATPIIVLFCGIILYFIIKRLIKRLFLLKKIDVKRQKTIINIFTNLVKYIIIVFSLIVILDAFGVETKAIIASVGVVGLIIGLALQDVIKDFVAGMFIILENQYVIGDYVTIDGFYGKVINFGLKSTKLLSFTGEVKTIPNRYIEQTINHSVENPVLNVIIPLSANYDIPKTKELINNVCKRLTKELINIKSDITLIGVVGVSSVYVRYRINVTIEPLTALSTQDAILVAIKTEVAQNEDKLLIRGKNGKVI